MNKEEILKIKNSLSLKETKLIRKAVSFLNISDIACLLGDDRNVFFEAAMDLRVSTGVTIAIIKATKFITFDTAERADLSSDEIKFLFSIAKEV